MGIALLSIVDLFTPLQSLASRWMSTKSPGHLGSAGLRYVGVRPSCADRQPPAARAGVPAPSRPVRVVRLVDAQQPHRHPGRLVISGRMADVCAELDRLVALEDADTLPRPARLH
jgi:hypothetical protein